MNLTTSSKDPVETETKDFQNDRADRKIKYGIGTIRLSLLIFIFFWIENCSLDTFMRLGIRYGLFGIGGGLLNLHKLSPRYELLILCILISNFIHEYVSCTNGSRHIVLFMYVFKTVIGDAIAGKLDNKIWFKFVTIALILWTVLSSQSLLPNIFQVIEMFYQEALIFGSHLLLHCLCEMGDNYYEKNLFFRHRYSYEICCVILYFLLCNNNNDYDNLSTSTILLFVDMFASLLYRVTNFIFVWIK